MTKTEKILLVIVAAALAVGVALGSPYKQKSGDPTPPQRSDSDSLSDGEVAQLLRLIDVNNTGKITRQQWMDFMAAEFNRLDANKSGVLSPAELSRSRLRVSSFVFPSRQKHTGMR
jgi:hypothetical protein